MHHFYVFDFFATDVRAKSSDSPNRRSKDLALIFAVENYENFESCSMVEAKEIADVLKKKYGFQVKIIRNPRKEDIERNLNLYTKKKYAEDAQLMILFSGHGKKHSKTKETCFLPKNAKKKSGNSWYAFSDIQAAVDKIPCKHILLSINAPLLEAKGVEVRTSNDLSFLGKNEATKSMDREAFIESELKKQTRFFISHTKASSEKKSTFLSAIQVTLNSDAGADNILSSAEFFEKISDTKVPCTITHFGSHATGGNFLFIRKKIIPKAEMVFVKGGTFQMGSVGGNEYSQPAHTVTVDGFYISKYEVTVGEYLAFVKATGANYPEWLDPNNGENIHTGYEDHYKRLGAPLTNPQCPIMGVSWLNAQAYCAWLSQKTGLKYRLPTEAEWEFAARGGTKSQGYTYAGSNDLDEVAWMRSNSGKVPHPIGQKKPNELGLYDMTGNVWEWVQDLYAPYTAEPQVNPKGPSSTRIGGVVFRGGGYSGFAERSVVSIRSDNPKFAQLVGIGFRVARD